MSDGPLFEWQPPRSMLVFPANRWTGKARHVAQTFLNQKTDRARQRYWNQTIDRMVQRLTDAGADVEDANAQIAPFREAVQSEIDKMTSRERMQK